MNTLVDTKRYHVTLTDNGDHELVNVHSMWICRDCCILAESQIGSTKTNRHHTQFVKVFLEQVIKPAKPTPAVSSVSAFSIYVKKRQYLFHIVCDNDLIFVALTSNTQHQQPCELVFDLLNNVKLAYLYEDTESFAESLCDLHHSYQLRANGIATPNMTGYRYRNSFDDEAPIYSSCSEDEPHCHDSDEEVPVEFDVDDEEEDEDDDEGDIHFLSAYLNEASFNNIISKTQPTTTLNLPSPSHSLRPMVTKATATPSNHMHIGTKLAMNASLSHHGVTPRAAEITEATLNPLLLPPAMTSNQRKMLTANMNMHSNHSLTTPSILDDGIEANVSEMEYIILKKGWMTKLGNTFKTWKYRYFELWSNGLLTYFEDELKLKKKGCINIVDEVMSCEVFSKSKTKKQGEQFGVKLHTQPRQWYFLVNKESVRDEWLSLFQTMTFSRIDLNVKFQAIKQRMQTLQCRWDTLYRHIQLDIDFDDTVQHNMQQMQRELKAASLVCEKCQKDIVYFKGSDLFPSYRHQIEYLAENMETLLISMENASCRSHTNQKLQSRAAANHGGNNNNNNNYLCTKDMFDIMESRVTAYANTKTPRSTRSRRSTVHSQYNPNTPKMRHEENRIILKAKLTLRLPSKNMLRSKSALSKKLRTLDVIIQHKCFKIDVDRDMTAPLVWKFDDIVNISDVKTVYQGARKKDNVKIADIHQYEFCVSHLCTRRVKFMFNQQQEAFQWCSTLKSLLEKNACNMPTSPVTVRNLDFDNGQIGL